MFYKVELVTLKKNFCTKSWVSSLTSKFCINLVTREFQISILVPAVFLRPLLLAFGGNLFWSMVYQVHLIIPERYCAYCSRLNPEVRGEHLGVWKRICLNMSQYLSFCFMFDVPHPLARLSRVIQHIFSRLAGAQYSDCITYLANTHFVWVCTNHPNFASLFIFMILNMSVCALFPMLHVFPSQHVPIHPAEWPWTTILKGQPYHLDLQRATLGPICLPAQILSHSSPLNPRYPVQASSQLEWKKTFTPQQWHQDFREPTLPKAASP